MRRTEAFREASASAEYNSGSMDGSRPGIFYVPIRDVKTYNTHQDEDSTDASFARKAIKTHFGISFQQENTERYGAERIKPGLITFRALYKDDLKRIRKEMEIDAEDRDMVPI